MGKHLTEQDIEAVVHLLDGWTGKLTWPELCKACKPVIGTAPTRQTLMKFTRVATAFKLRKGLRKGIEEQVPASKSLTVTVYAKRLLRLQQENARLTEENQQLLHQFVVWQYNTYARGLTQNDLNRPLPETNSSGSSSSKHKKTLLAAQTKQTRRTS